MDTAAKPIVEASTAVETNEDEWTDAEFKVDLERGRAKFRQAIQEAREEFRAGKIEPFPKP